MNIQLKPGHGNLQRPATPERRWFTLNELEQMERAGIVGPEERVELIDGEVITMAQDKKIKVPLYARHGVSEYWVINARDLVTTTYRGPGPDGYAHEVDVQPDQRLEPLLVPALALRLSELGIEGQGRRVD